MVNGRGKSRVQGQELGEPGLVGFVELEKSQSQAGNGLEAVMRMREEYWESGLRVTDEEAGLNCTAICCTVGW